jgi:hypothetical protein
MESPLLDPGERTDRPLRIVPSPHIRTMRYDAPHNNRFTSPKSTLDDALVTL